ncbi:hypothetical protein B0H12DRAFT_484113 [Mycena haematopus]|nr:hypothetical protein B0H12DRAFT_484113 [Mycena haematopus]
MANSHVCIEHHCHSSAVVETTMNEAAESPLLYSANARSSIFESTMRNPTCVSVAFTASGEHIRVSGSLAVASATSRNSNSEECCRTMLPTSSVKQHLRLFRLLRLCKDVKDAKDANLPKTHVFG